MQTRSVLALLFGVLLGTASSFGQFSFQSFDVPGSMATWASGIGPAGQIVGGYMDASGREHGYLYKDGTFITLDVPASLVGLPADAPNLETEVNGINPRGDMVGDYFAPPGAPDAPTCTIAHAPACHKGFLYKDGDFSSVLVPCRSQSPCPFPSSVSSVHVGSIPNAIAPDGTIYSCLHDQTFGNEMIGFIRIPQANGTRFEYKTLQAGDGEVTDPNQSSTPILNSMNNGATPDGSIIVGLYTPRGSARAHGYTVTNGHFADYMFPGSVATQIWGINPNGDFVGLYRDSALLLHGFLQPADGSAPVEINYVNPETGTIAVATEALGVNPAGAIVGTFVDSMGQHGFVTIRTRN